MDDRRRAEFPAATGGRYREIASAADSPRQSRGLAGWEMSKANKRFEKSRLEDRFFRLFVGRFYGPWDGSVDLFGHRLQRDG